MRFLIIGGDGMLGHQLIESLRTSHEIWATYRRTADSYGWMKPYLAPFAEFGVEATGAALREVIERAAPDVVVNAVGIVKQRAQSHDAIPSIRTNALFPHEVASLCRESGAHFIHVSTDCVFTGRKGEYREGDLEDATDLYGRSKLLGEVSDEGCITLRTSIIGLELHRRSGLVEWFLSQSGRVRGFARAIFSGFTTLEFARIVEHVARNRDLGSGLYHASSEPISKFELLCGLNQRLGRDVQIERDLEFSCDRSLNSDRFRRDFSYSPPSWEAMIEELAAQIRGRGR